MSCLLRECNEDWNDCHPYCLNGESQFEKCSNYKGEKVNIGDIYKHFKGNVYIVVDLTVDSDSLQTRVTYKRKDNNSDTRWSRPLNEFIGYKNNAKRFEKIKGE